jgi:hypothetical protein
MKKINSSLSIVFLVVFLSGCENQKKETTTEIVLTNTSALNLTDKAVALKRESLSVTDSINTHPLVIFNTDTIPSQLDDLDGDGAWDELFFVTNFSPKEQKTIQLKWADKTPEYPIRTSVRFGKREAMNEPVKAATEETVLATDMPKKIGFQKYQTDGPTWENDKVGFRHYLDGRNAKDIFGKKTPNISPENVGINAEGAVEDNYHVMEEWGRDIFPVGNSVGLGGFALFVDNEIQRLGVTVNDTLSNIQETNFRIIAEGPVKSVLKYTYNNWEAGGNSYNAEETTTIWPGMYGYKNTVEMESLQGNETLLVGLSNINNENPLIEVEIGDWVALIQHDSLTYERKWIMGTAILVPKNKYQGYIEAPKEGQLTDSFLAKIEIENKKPVSYYAIAGWALSADKNFKDAAYFKDYVVNLAKQLSTQITIDITTK